MVHRLGLDGRLDRVGKGTFKACYNIIAQNYYKDDKFKIEEAIRNYGLSKGIKYKDNSVTTKTNASVAIFKDGLQEEALKLCL